MKSRPLLLSAGWLVFVISFFIPTLHINGYGVKDQPGWAAACLSFITLFGVFQSLLEGTIVPRAVLIGALALCNVIVVVSVPMVLLRKGLRSLRIALTVAALLVCAPGIFPQLLFPSSDVEIGKMWFLAGYYFWALSFVLLAVAVNRK
jgi:hypothetical protein